MMDVITCFETSVLTRATWRHIPEGAILHTHRRENFKPYEEWLMVLIGAVAIGLQLLIHS
jgi:hypothetical protein